MDLYMKHNKVYTTLANNAVMFISTVNKFLSLVNAH